MKIFLIMTLSLSLLLLIKCQSDYEHESLSTIKKVKDIQEGVHLYVIDSCEYIGFIGTSIYGRDLNWGSHKGNCRFCIERNKKDIINSPQKALELK